MPDTSLTRLPCAPSAIDDFLSEPTPGVVDLLRRTPGPFLVLGAGGKIGLHLSVMLHRALERAGRRERVIAVSRFHTLRDAAAFTERGVETLPCDLADPTALAGLPDAPTVFFLAGVKFGTASSPELLRATNVELPARVAARFRRSRIVAYSSGCVYPFVTVASGGAVEATPVCANGDYAASCIAREEAFAAAAETHGNPIALIRLNYATEFRYGVLVDIAQWVLDGRPVDVTTGYLNAIWQRDAVAHSIQALELADHPAAPVNVTGPQILSVRDLAQRFGAALGRDVHITGAEAPTAWLNNAAWSHGLFGAAPTSLDDMVAWTAAWLQAGGETWHKPTGFERRDGRY